MGVGLEAGEGKERARSAAGSTAIVVAGEQASRGVRSDGSQSSQIGASARARRPSGPPRPTIRHMTPELLVLADASRPLGDALSQLFGRFHPLTVHFPIALLLTAAVFEGLNALRANDGLGRAAAWCLWAGTLGALVAGATGWVYVEVEGSREADVELHRWLGVAAASLALLTSIAALVARRAQRGSRPVLLYRVGLVLTALLVGGTGKIGGEMVWGEDWYFEPFEVPPERTPPDAAPAEEPSSDELSSDTAAADASAADALAADGAAVDAPIGYATHVAPLLEAHCYECHGPTGKADADLRLSDLVAAQESYFSFDWEALIVPGDAEASALFGVVSLARDAELAMPPQGEGEPLTEEQRALLRRWIEQGTSLEALLAD